MVLASLLADFSVVYSRFPLQDPTALFSRPGRRVVRRRTCTEAESLDQGLASLCIADKETNLSDRGLKMEQSIEAGAGYGVHGGIHEAHPHTSIYFSDVEEQTESHKSPKKPYLLALLFSTLFLLFAFRFQPSFLFFFFFSFIVFFVLFPHPTDLGHRT